MNLLLLNLTQILPTSALEVYETKCNNHFMNEMTDDWDNWRLFLAVARERGLAGAARVTGKSAPTLGRRMLMLERVTGKELFHRLPRGYELTEQGLTVFKKAASVESGILSLAHQHNLNEQALVKVSAGSWMTYGLCQNIKHMTQSAANIRVRFISAEAVLDISRRETTIGIRNNRPTQENLVCRKIGRVQFAGYAKRKSEQSWIQIHQNTPSAQWVREQNNSNAIIEVTSPRNALDLLNAGIGRAVLPTFIGDKTKSLKRVTNKIGSLSHDQWLVTHPDEQFQPAVRKVIDGVYLAAKSLHNCPKIK